MYNICIAILDHGSSRARAMGACATGNPGAVVIEYCKAALGAAFFYPIIEAKTGISYMQRGRERTPSFLCNMV